VHSSFGAKRGLNQVDGLGVPFQFAAEIGVRDADEQLRAFLCGFAT
jgi:hypothetical protein